MFFTLSQVVDLLIHYKYFILFPVTVIEGPITTVIGGFLSSLGYLNIVIVYMVVVVGDLVGDSIYYAIGRWGSRRFIEHWGKYIGLNKERTEHLESHFKKHSGKTLIIGKLTHAVGVVILFAAGVAKMPYWEFVWYNLIGTLPKSLIFVLIGFYFGRAYSQIGQYLDYAAITTIALAVLLIAVYLIIRAIGKKYEEKGMHGNNID